jgi:hypothetical protein
MDSSTMEKIQESCLGQHFDGYTEEKIDKNDGAENYAPQVDKYLDSLLAQELTKLTIKEREKSYEELHGVDDVVNETPELVFSSLVALDAELHRIAQKDAYWLAERQDQAYVTNPKFRLCFLRAEHFDPRKAAQRLVGFLEGKLQYFGESLLTKRIRFSDLDTDDQACFAHGQMQVLPSRDRTGRAIFCDMNMLKDPCYKRYKRPVNRLKTWIYILMTLAEDEENQKRGIVCLLMQLGRLSPSDINTELVKENSRLLKWTPLRFSAIHFCHEDPMLDFLTRIALLAMPSDLRSRHRIHKGPHTELLYSLMTFGIPVDLFPMGADSAIKKTKLNRWIARRKYKEFALEHLEGGFKGTDLPNREDVLLGKGKPIQMHMGNVKLRGLVDVHIDEYRATEKGLKRIVILQILESTKANSGRFLAQDQNGWWQEVSETEAKSKILKTILSVREKTGRDVTTSNFNVQRTEGASYENGSSFMFQREKRHKSETWDGCLS